MHLIRSTVATVVLVVVGLMAAACGGNAALSSVGPSSASGRASISGIVRGSAVTPTPSRALAEETFARNGLTDFRHMFIVPLACALASAVALALFFHPPKQPLVTEGGAGTR